MLRRINVCKLGWEVDNFENVETVESVDFDKKKKQGAGQRAT